MKRTRKSRILLFFVLIFIALAEIYFFSSQNTYTDTATTSSSTIAYPITSSAYSTTSVATTTTVPTTFTVISPQNVVYSNGRITISVRANEVSNWIGESIDGGSIVEECYNCMSFERYDISFPAGKHNLTAYVEGKDGKLETSVVNFEVK